MKRFVTFALAVFTFAVPAFAEIRGSWTATPSEKEQGRLHFNMQRRNSNMGQTMLVSSFTGLTPATINAGVQTPVQFELRREAGTLAFDGTFKEGFGAGQFLFRPNPSYVSSMRSMGIKGGNDVDDEDLMAFAIHDVSTSYIKAMQAEGVTEDLEEYIAMRIFNVSPELIREFRALGYRDVDADELVSTQIHGATPAYIRELRAAGFQNLKLDEVVASRIHKVTPEYAREMSALGYASTSLDDLVAFRIHKVTPEFIREINSLGYKNVDADDLVAMRIHRVTPEFIRELRDAGYTNVPIDKLVSMRIHGIDASFVKKMNSGS